MHKNKIVILFKMLTFLFVTQTALAAKNPVKMDFKIKMNGKDHEAQIITHFDQKATLTEVIHTVPNTGLEISVTPSKVTMPNDPTSTAIKLSLVVTEIQNGTKKVLISPEITVLDGKTGTLTQNSKDKEDFELSVTPHIVL